LDVLVQSAQLHFAVILIALSRLIGDLDQQQQLVVAASRLQVPPIQAYLDGNSQPLMK